METRVNGNPAVAGRANLVTTICIGDDGTSDIRCSSPETVYTPVNTAKPPVTIPATHNFIFDKFEPERRRRLQKGARDTHSIANGSIGHDTQSRRHRSRHHRHNHRTPKDCQSVNIGIHGSIHASRHHSSHKKDRGESPGPNDPGVAQQINKSMLTSRLGAFPLVGFRA